MDVEGPSRASSPPLVSQFLALAPVRVKHRTESLQRSRMVYRRMFFLRHPLVMPPDPRRRVLAHNRRKSSRDLRNSFLVTARQVKGLLQIRPLYSTRVNCLCESNGFVIRDALLRPLHSLVETRGQPKLSDRGSQKSPSRPRPAKIARISSG